MSDSRMPLTDAVQESIRRRNMMLREVEIQNRGRAIAVPVDDRAVRQKLRQLSEPMTLFGERKEDRRERLRRILAQLELEGVRVLDEHSGQKIEKKEEEDELFFTEGDERLCAARLFIAQYSLPRAAKRIEEERKLRNILDSEDYDGVDDIKKKEELFKDFNLWSNTASQTADARAIQAVRFTKDGNFAISGSWSSLIKRWSLPLCKLEMTYKGHEDRITGIAVNPDVNSKVSFASASADMKAKIWNFDSPNALHTFEGHTARLARLNFHPSGRFLGTCSYYGVWSLWDLESSTCLVEQEGHSTGVYDLAFQCDGSICASCDVGGIIRVWDLRTGRTVLPLTGHVQAVYSLDFAPNGFQLISGSGDHTTKIWDLRRKRVLYTLPAHLKLISSVKYEPNFGRFFVTASHDRTIKIWSSNEFKLLKTMKGHTEIIMDMDISNDAQKIASSSFDKTFKIWKKSGELNLDF